MKTIAIAVLSLLSLSAPALADQPPPERVDAAARRECFAELSRFTWKRGAEPPVGAGLEYMQALKQCDDLLAAAVERSVDYKVHEREAKVFAHQKKFVIAAYAVLWGVVVVFVVGVWLRQRKLTGKIEYLEAKLRAEEARGKSA